MKNLSTIILLLLFSLNSKAQLNANFPDSNYYWNEFHQYRDQVNNIYAYRCSIYSGAEVMMNAQNYREIHINLKVDTVINGTPYSYMRQKLYAYLRNDTTNNKVYILPVNSNQDMLLFDFNLTTGNTYPITYSNSVLNPNIYVSSTSDYVDPKGITRKKIIITNSSSPNSPPYVIIQGIGSLSGIYNFEIDTIKNSLPQLLSCISIDNESYSVVNSTSSLGNGSCVFINYTGIDVKKNKKINVFPNPVHNLFSIDINDVAAEFILTNSIGQIQKLNAIKADESWLFDISNLLPGVYYLKILTDETTYSAKILKE